MKLSVVFNNEAEHGFKPGWGFSCLIETGKPKRRVLFDTGCEGPSLLHNLMKAGYDAESIDAVVISHQHWDHTGGLFDLLKINNELKVFVLSSFSKPFKQEVKRRAELIEVKAPQKISEGIFTTGLIRNNPDEQSLIIKSSSGVVVVVGCSHPGLAEILKRARIHGKVYAIIGGFHAFSDFNVLKGVKIVAPCHCTQRIKAIKKRFSEQFKELKVGTTLRIR